MKKALLLLASAALLLVGCAKEKFADQQEGGMTTATFTASLENGVATKAAVDGDGKGTYVNRCIMEIYFQNELYTRLVQPVTSATGGAKAYATFANVPVVAGKQYQVLFWADCGGDGQIDKYYTTKTEGVGNKGLKAVTVNKTNFIDALKSKKNDELDAFFFADNYTVPQAGVSKTVTLYRPFAQLNVITTDVAAGKTVMRAELLPETVSVKYAAADTINVANGQLSGNYTYEYEAPVYGDKTNWTAVKNRGEFTLSMDYILASTEQGTVDVTFKTKNGENVVMTHNLTNLPYQRNYRTNVKGDLLTAGGTWKAEIEPKWGNGTDTGEIDHKIATSYTEVKTALQSGDKSDNLKVTVTPAAVNNLSDEEKAQVIVDETIDGTSVKALKFVLYEEKKSGEVITQHASPDHVEFELPERPTGVDAWKIEYETNYPTQTVVVSTPPEDTDPTIIIEAPRSTVTLDAAKINSVVSTTSENTLIIPQDLELKNLIVKKGAVEYHGTGLTMVKVEATGTDKVYFKTSERLADTDDVYGVVKDHVADGFAITKESETTWKIVPEVCKIGETGYASLSDAVAAVSDGQTITFVEDVENVAGIAINTGKTFTIDFAGHKYIVNKPGAGSTSTETSAFQLIKGQTITFKNGTIKAAEDNLSPAVAPAKNIKRMFQSYANVNFEDMTIDCTNLYGAYAANEFACGTVSMTGNTSISAKDGAKAINIDTWKNSYPEGAAVTINTTGTIGDIYLYAEGTGEGYTKSSLTIKRGTFATITDDGSEDWTAAVSGGTFTADPTKYLAPKCVVVLGDDGLYYVNKIYDCTATIEYPEGTVNEYNSFADAVKAAVSFGLESPDIIPEIVLWQDVTVSNGHNKTGYGAFNVVDYGVQNIKGLSINAQGHTMKCSPYTGGKIAEGIIKSSGGAHVILKNMNFAFTASASSCAKYCLDSKDGFFDLYNVNLINGGFYSQLNVSTNSTDAMIKFYEGTYACSFQGTSSFYKIFGGNFKTNPSKYLASDELTSYIRPEDGYYVVCNKSELPEISATLVDGSTISNFVGSEGPSVALSKASSGSILTLYSGNLSDSKNFSIFGDYLTIVQKGGVFSGEITTTAESCIIEEVPIDAETTKYQVVCNPTLAVAKIEQTGVNYPSLQSAINKITNTQNTVVLLTDLTNQVIPVNMNYSYTVDLNGKTVDCSSGSPLDFTNLQRNNATITGNGMIIARSISTGDGLIHADNWASVVITIKNGTYRVDSSSPSKIVIYVEDNNTKLIIEGGKYFGEISAPEGSLSILSGLFSVNPSAYIAEGKHVVSLSEVDPEYAEGYRYIVE